MGLCVAPVRESDPDLASKTPATPALFGPTGRNVARTALASESMCVWVCGHVCALGIGVSPGAIVATAKAGKLFS